MAASQFVILRGDQIFIDDNERLEWADKGNKWQDSWVPNTIHAVIWNNLVGQNEIQNIDPSTGMMSGNVDLNSTSDAVGSTTVADILSWIDVRMAEIKSAQLDYSNALENAQTQWVNDGNDVNDFNAGNSATSSYFDWSKTWVDYDENYS